MVWPCGEKVGVGSKSSKHRDDMWNEDQVEDNILVYETQFVDIKDTKLIDADTFDTQY